MSEPIFSRKRSSHGWVAVSFVLVPLYLVFFPYPGGKETLLIPVWALDLRHTAPVEETAPEPVGEPAEHGEQVFAFRAGRRFGYARIDGRLVHSAVTRYQVTLSDRGFIDYSSRPDHLVFMSPEGVFEYSVQSFGYPLLEAGGEALYTINADLGGLRRLNADGETLWQAEFASPVTSIALHGEKCLVGLLDGRAALYGASGEAEFEIDPGGSRISVILGTALAETGDLALTAGIDPQTLILVRRRDDGYEVGRSLTLDSEFRREVILRFGPGGRFLYVEQQGAVQVVELAGKRSARLPVPGRLTGLIAGRRFAAAAAEQDGKTALVVFRPPDSTLAVASIPGTSVWGRIVGGSLIVGLEHELVRSDVVER